MRGASAFAELRPRTLCDDKTAENSENRIYKGEKTLSSSAAGLIIHDEVLFRITSQNLVERVVEARIVVRDALRRSDFFLVPMEPDKK